MNTLYEVLPTLELKDTLATVFEDVIVKKVSSSARNNRFTFQIVAKQFIKKDDIRQLEREIKNQLFQGQNVEIRIQEMFELPTDYDAEKIFEEYESSMLSELKQDNPILYSLVEHGEIKIAKDEIIVTLEDSIVAREREKALVAFLNGVFTERCGVEVGVVVSYTTCKHVSLEQAATGKKEPSVETFLIQDISTKETSEKKLDYREMSQMKSDKRDQNSNASIKGKSFYRPKKINDPAIFYGRGFEGKSISICEIEGEIGEVIVGGYILDVDYREIKNEKTIVTITLTDETDTINVKIFVKNDVLSNIKPHIAKGKSIQIKGVAIYDTFSKEIIIGSVVGMRKSDEKTVGGCGTGKRFDNASEKRVELHCHTKLSNMDGLSDPAEVIELANAWGHKAVAITDHGVVQAFPVVNKALKKIKSEKRLKNPDFKIIYGVEAYLIDDIYGLNTKESVSKEELRKEKSYHTILLAQNEVGRVNLYTLISYSHLEYFYRVPKIPKSLLNQYREGIIVGSACEAGELISAIVKEESAERIRELVDYYDYLEIQPTGNNMFMIASEEYPKINNVEDIRNINRKIVELGELYGKKVAATCDTHFLNPEDEIYRTIVLRSKGMNKKEEECPLYFRTTEEMLEEFSYLGWEKAKEVVIKNTNEIADMIEAISPVRPDKCPPVIEDSDKTLREICYRKAHEIYGENLPKQVSERLERELTSIITNGFAVMYIIAQKLVWKSMEDGYLVGSRGSVGSSFVATMAGITEVNPLSPHYYCKECHYSDFESTEVKAYAGRAGCDMPKKLCPVCGNELKKDGFDIPFETFLGFKGDKEPDIDLNFSGEYQSKAHKYTEVIFGAGQTFRAGTIAAIAEKTAFGMVKGYFEEKGVHKRFCEVTRLAGKCTGVRRSTGQHPGGIVVLPLGENIHSFTPIQHPANDMTTDIITTHFDYHSIDHNLLKLDILGHDDPTMIRMLQDLTGINPLEIPLDDSEVMSLFQNTSALGVEPKDILGCKLGCLGIPEFGTDFAMQMLIETKPQAFSDLVRISGLSHGTDVWIGNARDLILDGQATISTAICTRDDIMTYLIGMGMDSALSFTTMESVRKGRGLTSEMEEAMKKAGVPQWYIDSCKKIQYMFPKAHAAAYVMMAWRIAYCKINYPLAYYATYFSIRATSFDYETMCQGKEHLEEALRKEENKDTIKDMRIVQEMYARGFEFIPIDIYRAKAAKFQIIDGKIMPSLTSIGGLGEKAAQSLEVAAKEGAFLSKDDFRQRTKISSTIADLMERLGLLGDIPESNQISLFEWMKTSDTVI